MDKFLNKICELQILYDSIESICTLLNIDFNKILTEAKNFAKTSYVINYEEALKLIRNRLLTKGK